jgi:hypothetical protein
MASSPSITKATKGPELKNPTRASKKPYQNEKLRFDFAQK